MVDGNTVYYNYGFTLCLSARAVIYCMYVDINQIIVKKKDQMIPKLVFAAILVIYTRNPRIIADFLKCRKHRY